MAIVAGLDCSTGHTRIVACDAAGGAVLRADRAAHPATAPDGPGVAEADPQAWLHSLGEAAAGGVLQNVRAIGVAAQQHGMIALDERGRPVRPALLWNDTRASAAAAALVEEAGGAAAWAQAVGAVPSASYTVAKLRWLAEFEPEAARHTAEVLLPHDWLVRQLLGRPARATTDRGDASGTGYWSPLTDGYRGDLVRLALGHRPRLPEVLGPAEPAGRSPEGLLIAAGTGDTMALALGLGLGRGDAVVSLGRTGTVFAVHDGPVVDPSGTVASFADATGRHLPLVRTLNAAGVVGAAARMLGTDPEGLSALALRSVPGSHGLVLLPYLDGERTPRLPQASGTLAGLRAESMRPEHVARAALEGVLCGFADALDALRGRGVPVRRVFLTGAGARPAAVRRIACMVFGVPVVVPAPGYHAAVGAARQAAWVLSGATEPPEWPLPEAVTVEPDGDALLGEAVRQQFAAVREQMHPGAGAGD